MELAILGLSGMQITAVDPESVSSELLIVSGTVIGFRKRFLKNKTDQDEFYSRIN